MKSSTIVFAFLIASTAYAGSYVDQNGVTHFYKDTKAGFSSPPTSYGAVDQSNEQNAQQKLAADRAKFAQEEEQRAKAAAAQHELRLKEIAAEAAVRQAQAQGAQAAAQAEQARQQAITNQILMRRAPPVGVNTQGGPVYDDSPSDP